MWDDVVMADRPRYRPGEQPYDRLNAIRIGAMTGGMVGAIPAAILRGGFALLLVVGAIAGALVGRWWADHRE
jgi:outer membrane lipoprotein SlyB